MIKMCIPAHCTTNSYQSKPPRLLWSCLPDAVHLSDTFNSFQCHLKTHLFQAIFSTPSDKFQYLWFILVTTGTLSIGWSDVTVIYGTIDLHVVGKPWYVVWCEKMVKIYSSFVCSNFIFVQLKSQQCTRMAWLLTYYESDIKISVLAPNIVAKQLA